MISWPTKMTMADIMNFPSTGLAGSLMAISTALMICAPISATAQEAFPSRPVKIVVAYPPGASTDIVARLIADKMSQNTGQQFIVENRDGAGGNIGNEYVSRADPDGYTILFAASGSLVISPHVVSDLRYSPMEDLKSVAMVSSYSQFFVTSADFGAPDLASFVDKVKGEPGVYNYASPGVGITQHIALAAFSGIANLEMEHIPYPGTAPAILDVIANRAAIGMAAITTIKPHVDAGKLVPLVVLSNKRVEQMPDVPTMAEAGFPEFMDLTSWQTWQAVLAPAGTPDDIVLQLNTYVNDALKDPDVAARLAALAQDNLVGSTPESTEAFIRSEDQAWSNVITQFGISAE